MNIKKPFHFDPKFLKELPAIALKNIVLFPRIIIPLAVQRAQSVAALEQVSRSEGLAVFVTQRNMDTENVRPDDLYCVAVVGKILNVVEHEDGSKRVDVEGIARVRIKDFLQTEPYIRVVAEAMELRLPKPSPELEALMRSVVDLLRDIMAVLGRPMQPELYGLLRELKDVDQLVNLVIFNIGLEVEKQQQLLEENDIEKVLKQVHKMLMQEHEIISAERRVTMETRKRLGKMQREAFLREQMKSIEKELGMETEKGEIDAYRKKIDAALMPSAVREKAIKELMRLEKMPSFAPEVSYIRTYLDWLVELPWARKSESKIDLKKAEQILENDHYGLEKVKERILEYLAVQKQVGKIKGPILCFVGPPGTGKTSIGRSIARSLGREFHRLSLGGIRDEAEIRGHRRTYVGALPGRIIQGVHTVKSKNPVFMLDEIDKLGRDFRGDPSSALLEALDPEQNHEFSDHYLEVPFDLSDVMFITTANMLDTIPYALRDRLEVIEFRGYTDDEKLHIAKKFLMPKLQAEHGLKNLFKIEDDAILEIIRRYTLEAGVRNLERQFAKVMRKIVRHYVENGKARKSMVITVKHVAKYLGVPKYTTQWSEKEDQVGVATGLAVTAYGGEVMAIEAIKMPGKGKLSLTGRLGKTMQESAMAALSYARARTQESSQNGDFYSYDIHLHVPSGAIPKDGPSAGIAMASALVSLLFGKKLHKEVGMTGEVTLRGKVLEVGGIKEKVLAAHRAGLKKVILPKDNEKELEEVPKEIRRELQFTFAENMEDVLDVVMRSEAKYEHVMKRTGRIAPVVSAPTA